jgi:hypothetical protein
MEEKTYQQTLTHKSLPYHKLISVYKTKQTYKETELHQYLIGNKPTLSTCVKHFTHFFVTLSGRLMYSGTSVHEFSSFLEAVRHPKRS